MTQKPLEVSDLYEQYAVKAAISQFLALNEQLNKGTIKMPKQDEEAKEPVPAPIQAMHMTMSNLKSDFIKQHNQ